MDVKNINTAASKYFTQKLLDLQKVSEIKQKKSFQCFFFFFLRTCHFFKQSFRLKINVEFSASQISVLLLAAVIYDS